MEPREEVLDIAAGLLVARGFAATSTRDIAEPWAFEPFGAAREELGAAYARLGSQIAAAYPNVAMTRPSRPSSPTRASVSAWPIRQASTRQQHERLI